MTWSFRNGGGLGGRSPLVAAAALLTLVPLPASAQQIELAPFIGLRGGDEPYVYTARVASIDRQPSIGVTLNVPLWEGLQFEGFVTHEPLRLVVYPDAFGPGGIAHGAVDHYEAGALQEFGRGQMRPFLSGLLGLTRYAIEGDNEVRFSVAAGGGVKLFPVSRFGVRVDGRVYTTFLDATTTRGVCGGYGCLLGLHFDVAWQFEATAGIVFKLGPGT